MEIRDRLGSGPRARVLSGSNRFFTLATVTLLLLSVRAEGQWTGRDGWIEEPAAKSLNVEGDAGRSYLDTASVHRGDDGLVYFSESSNVMRPEEIGKVGFMKDAYDCARNIKYMCVELGRGNWRNDRNSMVNAADQPALPVYRKYLCGDPDRADDSAGSHTR
jgi:hypothetical protein